MLCSYLGRFDKSLSSYSGPSYNHICHAVGTPEWPYSQAHITWQQEFCLGNQFRQCPRFANAQQRDVPALRPVPARWRWFQLPIFGHRSALEAPLSRRRWPARSIGATPPTSGQRCQSRQDLRAGQRHRSRDRRQRGTNSGPSTLFAGTIAADGSGSTRPTYRRQGSGASHHDRHPSQKNDPLHRAVTPAAGGERGPAADPGCRPRRILLAMPTMPITSTGRPLVSTSSPRPARVGPARPGGLGSPPGQDRLRPDQRRLPDGRRRRARHLPR